MATSFYLSNSSNNKAHILNVPTKEGYVRAFEDISLLDLACLDLGLNLDEIIKECNPGVDIKDAYYILQTPAKYTFKKALASVIASDPAAQETLDMFRYFAEQRAYNIANNNSKTLKEGHKLDHYIQYLMRGIYDLPEEDQHIIYCKDSLLTDKLREILYLKTTGYPNDAVGAYFDYYSMTLRSILSGYTELRKLTIMYIELKLKHSCPTRTILNDQTRMFADKLFDMTSEDIANNIKKYTDKEEKEIKQKLQDIENEQYQQLDFSSFIPGFEMPTGKRGRVKDLLDY